MHKPQAPGDSTADRVRALLQRSDAADALEEALARAYLVELPSQPEGLVHFFEHALLDALIGRLHPATARGIVEELVQSVAADGSGSRLKAPMRETPGVATVPPPPLEDGHQAYDDLASGAVHTRPTPVWGIARPGAAEASGNLLWIVVSTDPALTEQMARSTPSGAEFLVADTMADLKAAAERGDHPHSSIVIDAVSPSLPLDQTVAALVEEATSARILLWRMHKEAHDLLLEAVPVARTWLSCEAEVTPIEIVQLLGLMAKR
jgi:hypothetical protein